MIADAVADFVCEHATRHCASSLGGDGIDSLLARVSTDATRQRIVDGWPHVCAFDGDVIAGVIVIKPPTHLHHLFVATDLQRTGIGR